MFQVFLKKYAENAENFFLTPFRRTGKKNNFLTGSPDLLPLSLSPTYTTLHLSPSSSSRSSCCCLLLFLSMAYHNSLSYSFSCCCLLFVSPSSSEQATPCRV